MTNRAQDFHIIIDEVNLTDLGFGKEFRAAVEAKKVAQQDAERAKFLVDRAIQDKRSAIIKALGEARSIELLGGAIEENPNFLQLRKLEAIRDIADTLSGSKNRIWLDSSNLMFDSLSEDFRDMKQVSTEKPTGTHYQALYTELNTRYSDEDSNVIHHVEREIHQ